MIQNGEQYRSALRKVGELTRDIADMDDQVFLFPAEKTELLKLKNLRDSLELEMRAYRQAQQPPARDGGIDRLG